MAMMGELQYLSAGRQIYYHFGNAYGRTGQFCPTWKHEILVYLGTEAQVKDALAMGKLSVRKIVNEILDRERSAVTSRISEVQDG